MSGKHVSQRSEYDIIFISGEPYVDHPFSGVGILKRVLEDKGFSVAVIETPNVKSDSDFLKFGAPKLFFAVSSGAMDSMLFNYTPLKKKRAESEFSDLSYRVPERALIHYCNILRRLFKGSKIVIGGVEGSLRRFTHYDYWDNALRKPILFDTRADVLVYGYGELSLAEIASRFRSDKSIEGVPGTCILSKELPTGFEVLPSFEDVSSDTMEFCNMQNMFDANKHLAQHVGGQTGRYVLQYPKMKYHSADLDYIYDLDYSREIPPAYKEFNVVRNSVLTHRGCFGGCNFCSIAQNSGKEVISRSKKSILAEVRKIVAMSGFDGQIELSGASANMYAMDCSVECGKSCFSCKKLDRSHSVMVDLLRSVRAVKGVKSVVIRSGVRYDLALESDEYVEEIVKHHIDGKLMIAPEHVDKEVLRLMNKPGGVDEFVRKFKEIARKEGKDIEISFYTMVGHPGCNIDNSKSLSGFVSENKNSKYTQVFTPTPMTVSTCMYYTGLDPKTLEPVYVPYSYSEKKLQKNLAVNQKSNRIIKKKNLKK